ncbi:MAG: hypothetical protein ACI9KE_005622 [Polyangiales bacterium]|jgi:hypothetical protein
MKHVPFALAFLAACGGVPAQESAVAHPDEGSAYAGSDAHEESTPADAKPIDGVVEMVRHGIHADGEIDAFYAIRWDAEERTYRASRYDHPDRSEALPADSFLSIVALTEARRDALSLSVESDDFLIIRGGHISIGLASAAPEGTSAEEVARLRSFSDQWMLLGDVADGTERENRRLATYRDIRQSMENLNTVCSAPQSERCINHTSYTAAYNEVASAIEVVVNTALGGEPADAAHEE